MVDWLKRGISGRFWYGNEPSGALVLGIYYLRTYYHLKRDSISWTLLLLHDRFTNMM
jgi:hypothetical protein